MYFPKGCCKLTIPKSICSYQVTSVFPELLVFGFMWTSVEENMLLNFSRASSGMLKLPPHCKQPPSADTHTPSLAQGKLGDCISEGKIFKIVNFA